MPHAEPPVGPGVGDPLQPGLIAGLARWCVRRHWLVLGAWVALIAALVALTRAAGGDYVDDFVLPGAPSQDASDLLRERFPSLAGDSAVLVVQAPGGLTDPALAARLRDMFTAASGLPDVAAIILPTQAP